MTGGEPNAMANDLPVVLSTTMQDLLTGLPANLVSSWADLCNKFINNFYGTFTNPKIDWNLY